MTNNPRIALRRTLVLLRHTLKKAENEPSHLLSTSSLLGFNFEAGLELDLDILAAGAALVRDQTRASAAPSARLNSSIGTRCRSLPGVFGGFSLPDAPVFDEWVHTQQMGWGNLVGLVLDYPSWRAQAEIGDTTSAITTAGGSGGS